MCWLISELITIILINWVGDVISWFDFDRDSMG